MCGGINLFERGGGGKIILRFRVSWGGNPAVFGCECSTPSTYPSDDSQMFSSLLKSKLGSRSWGNSNSSWSSWSSAAPLPSSTPVMTGTSGSTGEDGGLLGARVSRALLSLPLRLWASVCGTEKHHAASRSIFSATHQQAAACRMQTKQHPCNNTQRQHTVPPVSPKIK